MAIDTTYTNGANAASTLNRVAEDQEVVIVAPAQPLRMSLYDSGGRAGLIETAHLLRSPKNAQRLLSALRRSEAGRAKPLSVEKLRREMGLEPNR